MALDFPANPTVNQTVSYQGRTWRFNGTGWQLQTQPSEIPELLADFAAVEALVATFDARLTAFQQAAPIGTPTWVSFNGTLQADVSATYVRSGTTVTVSSTAHGYLPGHVVSLDFTSGTASDGVFTIVSVPDANTFTVTHGTSGSTSGNVAIKRCQINAHNNVHSISDCGTGDYVINFAAALVDANYAAAGMAPSSATNNPKTVVDYHANSQTSAPTTKTPQALRILVGSTNQAAPAGIDCSSVGVIIVR